MEQALRTAVVILAGGEGRRIGGGKPSRRLAGRTLLDHALALARQWSDEVAIAVRDPGQVDKVDAQLLLDREGAGPIAGIASALAFAAAGGFDAVLTTPTDTPLLPADLLERLADALLSPPCTQGGGGGGYASGNAQVYDERTHPQPLPACREGSLVAVPSSAGRLHPASSLWRREVAGLVPGYLATGRGSILGLAEHAGYAETEWPVEPFDPFLNINGADDLAAAEAILRSR